MKKYYLFGAGNNAWGVIAYFGRKNFIAIIDNEIKKVGTRLNDLPIISFEQYMTVHGEETIIVTAAVFDTIVSQLENAGIYNYYVAPMIQFGLADPRQIIREIQIDQQESLVIYGWNPLTEKFIDVLREDGIEIKLRVLSEDGKESNVGEVPIETIDYHQLKKDDRILMFTCDTKSNIYRKIKERKNTIDIFTLVSDSNRRCGKKLVKYKDLHRGECCFIVGNGPSLRIKDLEQIKDSHICSFGMNLAYNIYDRTSWRPSYYVISDYNILREYYGEIKKLRRDNLFIKNFYYMDETPYIEATNYYPGYPIRNYYINEKFSDDIATAVYAGYSVTYDALQIAAYMGFKKIYLIGNDFSYMGDPADKGNHFYDNKVSDKRVVAGRPYIHLTLEAFGAAKEYADLNGIEIWNATRGGKLEVFQRIDFDKLFDTMED